MSRGFVELCGEVRAKAGYNRRKFVGSVRVVEETGTLLTTRRMRLNCLALAQGAKKALKHVNGVLLDPRRGAFGKSVRRNLEKVMFSGTGSTFSGGRFAKVARAYARSEKVKGVKVANAESLVLPKEGPKKGSK